LSNNIVSIQKKVAFIGLFLYNVKARNEAR